MWRLLGRPDWSDMGITVAFLLKDQDEIVAARALLARYPILMRLSDKNSYSGTNRFSGAGPFLILPAVS